MSVTRIAVLRGGMGGEHEVSLRSGAVILNHLATHEEKRGTSVLDVFIDRSGEWYVRGIKKDPAQALLGVDVVWNALHGEYGEDGTVQQILDRVGVPYTGSGAYASALSMNKVLTKDVIQRTGIKVPRAVVLSVSPTLKHDVLQIFRSFPFPAIVKPVRGGSSVGVRLVSSFDEFFEGVRSAFSFAPHVMVEEYIRGTEATVGVVDALRNEKHYRLPPIRIVSSDPDGVFSYQAKYSGESIEQCPATFSQSVLKELQDAASTVHTHLGLRHYSRSDFIVSPHGIYFLEVNALPGTTH